MKTNYLKEEMRNQQIDAMIKLLEEAKKDETKLFEVKGFLKGTIEQREEARISKSEDTIQNDDELCELIKQKIRDNIREAREEKSQVLIQYEKAQRERDAITMLLLETKAESIIGRINAYSQTIEIINKAFKTNVICNI